MDGNSLEQEDQLPNELLTFIFQFLPFNDLKNALMICRLARASKILPEQILKNQETIFHFCFNLKALEGRGGAALPVVFTQTEVEGGWHCKEHASPSGGSQYEKAADP